MKIVRLEISVKRYAEIAVAVPDDFDERKLLHSVNAEALATAADDAEWDDPFGEPVEVEIYEVLTGDALAKELKDFGPPTDVSAALAAIEERLAASRAAAAAKKESP